MRMDVEQDQLLSIKECIGLMTVCKNLKEVGGHEETASWQLVESLYDLEAESSFLNPCIQDSISNKVVRQPATLSAHKSLSVSDLCTYASKHEEVCPSRHGNAVEVHWLEERLRCKRNVRGGGRSNGPEPLQLKPSVTSPISRAWRI